MSSEVDDTIELRLIDTRQLVEEARKIRKAKDLAQQSSQVQRKLAAGISPLGMGSQASNLPKGFFAGGPQSFKGSVTGARTDNAFKNLQQSNKQLQDDLKKMKSAQTAFERKIAGNVNLASQILTANISNVPSTILTGIGKFGIIGSLIAGSVGTIIEELSKQFQRGGIFSTKLKVTKQALTLNDVEVENEYRAGTKYITGELRIVQRAPESSNTANIKHESIRFTMENLGRT
jgi:hypothetical protein